MKQVGVFIAFVVFFVCFCGIADAVPPTHVISGTVQTADSTGIEGVDVAGDNGAGSTVTGVDGAYSITVANHWDGTISVSKTGWLITPPSKTYTKVSGDFTAQNYTAYQPTISGYVQKGDGTPLAGATVTADNGGGSAATDASGYYEFFLPYGWSGNVSASLAGYYFAGNGFANVTTDQVDQNFSGYQPTISGTTGVSGVTVSGVGSVTSTPNYSITVPYGWTGTVSADKAGYNFTHSPRSYVNVTSNQVGQDFTPYQPTISGSTSVSGATVTISGVGTVTSTPAYSVVIPYGWSGTVSASLAGYNFADSPKSYSNVTSNQTEQDFTPYQPMISGSTSVSGATVTISGVGTVSSTPTYSVVVPYGWTGTVSASLADYNFVDSPKSFTNVTANQTDQDFTPYQPTISGSTSVSGATITISGVGTVTSTPAYSVVVPYGWSGTILAEVAEYGFSGSPRVHTNVIADQNDQNFTPYQPTISGSTSVSGATVTVSGVGTVTSTPAYSVVVPYGWSGTVEVSLADFGFFESPKIYTNVSDNLTNQNFTPFQPLISGSTGVAGVTVIVSGIVSVTSTPEYSVVVPYGWTGTIEADLTGYYFPESPKSYTNVTANQNNQNFTAFQPKISGSATNETGYPLAGVAVTADNGGGSDTTDANGDYEIAVAYNWSGVVDIEKLDWFFDPNSMSYTNVTINQTGQDYTGTYIGITGSGTQEDPYLIENMADFDEFARNNFYWASGVYTKLMCNLDLSGRNYSRAVIAPDTDIYHAWYTGTPFSGNFDGNGHAIQNLTITQQSYYIDHVGLFGEIRQGVVENLGVENVTIMLDDDSYSAGGLVATNNGIIRNCYTTGIIEDGLDNLGGIAGDNGRDALIIDSYSTCEIFGRYDCEDLGGLVGVNYGRLERCSTYDGGAWAFENSALGVGGLAGRNNGDIVYCNSGSTAYAWSNSYAVGGLVGRNNAGNIAYCYSYGIVHGWSTTQYIGGLVGWNDYGIIENCYTTASVRSSFTPPASFGQFAGRNSIYSTIRNCFSTGTTEEAIGLNQGTIINLECHPTESMQQQATFTDGPARWDFVGEYVNGGSDDWSMPKEGGYPIHWWQLNPWPELPAFAGGSGTAEDPYLIFDCNDLNRIGHNPRLMDKSFRLVDNIDCIDAFFFTIGEGVLPFAGIFDGQFHKILNIHYQTNKNENVGFFSYLDSSCLVKSLGLENIFIQAPRAENVGTMAGVSYGQIQSCFAEGVLTVETDSKFVGGLCGLNEGTIEQSFSSMQISAGDNLYALGGFVGRNFGSVRQCYSEGLVSSGTSSQSVGGFIGQYLEGQDCVECASWTAISTGESSSLVGGFIGQREGYDSSGIISCYWDIETSGISDPEEGFPDTDGIAGLPTTQMQTQSTFTGWDFVDEVLNGTDDIWAVCEGTNYPRLVWQIPTGDFVCPDGVSAEDMQFLAARWLDTDYGTVEGAELSGDGFVGVEDIMAVAEYWLAIDCGDCDGRDVTGDGNVNMADLAYISQRWSMSEYGNCDGAELTGDGKIDLADLAVFAGNWLSGVE